VRIDRYYSSVLFLKGDNERKNIAGYPVHCLHNEMEKAGDNPQVAFSQ
jgi:hypothetical protein